MPLNFHVYDGPKTPDSAPWMGQERYATDPNSATQTGQGGQTNADNDRLGEFTARALLRYRDVDAYYCSGCNSVFGVKCPRCGLCSDGYDVLRMNTIGHALSNGGERTFRMIPEYDWFEGLVWVRVACRKCDFEFRVTKR